MAVRRSLAAALLSRLVALLIAMGGIGLAALPATAGAPDALVIRTASGEHRFTVEWATTEAERERGLMNRKHMAADHGMLFDFGSDQMVAFWMKNTPLSLDMVFIAADGTVERVEHRAKPFSLAVIPSGAAVRYVFEIVGGTADAISIEPGSTVEIPAR